MELDVGSWNLCSQRGFVKVREADAWSVSRMRSRDQMYIRSPNDVSTLSDNFSIMNFMSALLEPISIIAIK
jgi:hypothetical protein